MSLKESRSVNIRMISEECVTANWSNSWWKFYCCNFTVLFSSGLSGKYIYQCWESEDVISVLMLCSTGSLHLMLTLKMYSIWLMICLPHPQKRRSWFLSDPSGQPESDHEGYSAEGPQKEEGLPERIRWDISKIHISLNVKKRMCFIFNLIFLILWCWIIYFGK